jgi:hypothetical protein
MAEVSDLMRHLLRARQCHPERMIARTKTSLDRVPRRVEPVERDIQRTFERGQLSECQLGQSSRGFVEHRRD